MSKLPLYNSKKSFYFVSTLSFFEREPAKSFGRVSSLQFSPVKDGTVGFVFMAFPEHNYFWIYSTISKWRFIF
jgi:hypothetical protein